MKRKFFLEQGNWDKAAEILQGAEPLKFPTVEDAKHFLLENVIAEFSNVPSKTIMDHEWMYGSILALAAGGRNFVQHTAAGRFERIQVRFWLSLKTDDRSDVEILETPLI